MSITIGYRYECDRPDCDETISLVPRGRDIGGLLTDAGWEWTRTGRLRHFCPKHGRNTKTAPKDGLRAAYPNEGKESSSADSEGKSASCPKLTIA